MGAVAAALQERGFKVTGSDESVYPPMSTFLEQSGIKFYQGYDKKNIPSDADVVVIGNAMTRGNPEVEAVLNRKLFYLSLPEVLKNYFLRGQTQSGRYRNTWKNHDHRTASLAHGKGRAKTRLSDRRHS